jgi:outer membrane receptor for ferrienterochelin and colicin
MNKFLFIILFSSVIYTQDTVKGKVTYDNNLALAGVNIFWKNTQIGTTSNAKGEYEIKKTNESNTLVFSYTGFKNQDVAVSQQKQIDVVLDFDDSLDEITIKQIRTGLQKSSITAANMQTMTAKEFLKAACCNLSESFETNPSIDVNFTDAVSGTRQIRMLGLTSPYIAMTEENTLSMRGGLQYPGLSYIPGTWVNSIQITKGAGSVINGYESISGQINIEYLKPADEPLFFVNAYTGVDGRYELNTHINTKLSEHWSTGLFIHGNTRVNKNDMNHDGFLDNPLMKQINILNKWQYGICGKDGLNAEITWRYLYEDKTAGQVNFDDNHAGHHNGQNLFWGAGSKTNLFDISTKLGFVFPEQDYQSMGWQTKFTHFVQDAYFGIRPYEVSQTNFYTNVLFASIINNIKNKFTAGASFLYDDIREVVFFHTHHQNSHIQENPLISRKEYGAGAFFEYAFNDDDKWSYNLGGRLDYHNRMGFFATPRGHMRYKLFDDTTLRLSAGRGQRLANIFMENQNLFASNRQFVILHPNHQEDHGVYGLKPEIAWNYGLSIMQKFKLFNKAADIGFDFYRTDFTNQIVVDVDASPQAVQFYNLDGQSFANSLQVDFNYEPFPRFLWRMSYKYFDVRQDNSLGLVQRVLQPKNRWFSNIEYQLNTKNADRVWKFDATFNWLSTQRLPDTSSNPLAFQAAASAPSFATLNAQVTKVFSKKFEVYVGGENIGNYQQANAIIAAAEPFSQYFDSSMIYGPVFGAMYYAGVRWKFDN